MTVLLIAQAKVNCANGWSEYSQKAQKTLVSAGAKVIGKGTNGGLIQGVFSPSGAVVIEFESMSSLNSWYNSEEYQELIPIRNAAAEVLFTTFDKA